MEKSVGYEIVKQSAIALAKSSLAAMPYGALINEIVFDIRSRVRTERLLAFVEYFLEDIEKKGITTKLLEEKKDSEIFTDYLEEILKTIAQKDHSKKYRYFSKLLNDSLVSEDFDFSKHSIFCEILSKVSNEEILLLRDHFNTIVQQSSEEGTDPDNSFRIISLHLNNAYSRPMEEAVSGTPVKWDHDRAVLVDHLIQVGIMTDCSFTSMDANARERVCLTDLGYEFIKYISSDHYND